MLRRNPNAVQIGLTATPRRIEVGTRTKETVEDERIAADNIRHFGEPVYEYDMAQGIEDGYLAACEIVRRDIFLDEKPASERLTGIDQADFAGKRVIDARTGEVLIAAEMRGHYEAASFERRLTLPDRVAGMAFDLFEQLLATGGPEQKTIVFCASDAHADAVAIELNNRYAEWCADVGAARKEQYAFKCTAASSGNDYLADFRGSSQRFFVATTVDLLTTGVDVPNVRNVVFFKYVRSPIAFYQMVGRGTRIHEASGKLMFRVYDYTDATRLFGEAFVTRLGTTREAPTPIGPQPDGERTIQVEGVQIRVTDAGRLIVAMVDGKATPITVEAYKARLAAKLVEAAPTLDAFRARWVSSERRQEMLAGLAAAGLSPTLVQELEDMSDYDLYDVLAELGYGQAPRTRSERAEAFLYKHAEWLAGIPEETSATVRAFAAQFARAGTEELEKREIFSLPAVQKAGGIAALKLIGKPFEVLRETKERMFAA